MGHLQNGGDHQASTKPSQTLVNLHSSVTQAVICPGSPAFEGAPKVPPHDGPMAVQGLPFAACQQVRACGVGTEGPREPRCIRS